MFTQEKLKRVLQSVGKATFKNCYNEFAENYMKEDKHKLEEAIMKEGLNRTGKKYEEGSVTTKVNAGCSIFSNGCQKEALKLCK